MINMLKKEPIDIRDIIKDWLLKFKKKLKIAWLRLILLEFKKKFKIKDLIWKLYLMVLILSKMMHIGVKAYNNIALKNGLNLI